MTRNQGPLFVLLRVISWIVLGSKLPTRGESFEK